MLPLNMNSPKKIDFTDGKIREETFHSVRKVIQEGRLTLFLGAGASSIRPRELTGPRWDLISNRFLFLVGSLKNESEKSYIRTLAKSRRLKIVDSKSHGSIGERDKITFQFIIRLAKLNCYLTTLFGQEMARFSAAVSDCGNYEMRLPDKAQEKRATKLADCLLRVVDEAKELHDNYKPPKVGLPLEVRAIYHALLLLCYTMIPQRVYNSQKLKEWRKRHKEEFENLTSNGQGGSKTTIRLDELAWLTDLLWYVLRDGSPAYPTTSELTFQLSLNARSYTLRRGELAQVAEIHGHYKNQIELIRNSLEYCEKAQHEPNRFHLGMAATLYSTYLVYKNRCKGSAKVEETASYLLGNQDVPWRPIIVTTNYDRAIEKALEHLNVTYHVVFPVYAAPKSGKESIEWLYKTFHKQGERTEMPIKLCTRSAPRIDDSTLPLEGPIIIKLHGSPLETLPHLPMEGLDYMKMEHFLVLSESSYLETILRRESLPEWVEEEFKASERVFWFLGYSLSDWNIRLRLYEHVYHSSELTIPPEKYAFDRSFDLFRLAVLGTLNVLVYEGELETFGKMVSQVPEVEKILERVIR